VRQWARRDTRPCQPADQRYESAYLFGAICPARGIGAGLALPYAGTEAMQLHLDTISRKVARGAHAVLLLDRAGWHTTGHLTIPKNMTLIFLPSRAPKLNPVENICSTCARPGSRTGSSTLTRPFSMPLARLGTASWPSPEPSPQSKCASGLMSVNNESRWYYTLRGPRPGL
jgi:hypothetical protein